MLIRFCLATAVLATTLSQASALSIQFDYTYDTNGFFTPQRRTTLEAAGLWFGERLADNLSAITPNDGNTWAQSFFHPSGGNNVSLTDSTIAADTIVIYVGASDLGGQTLGRGGFGGFSVGGTSQSWVDTVVARGQSGALLNPQTDLGIWGGSISFDLTTTWYSDQDTSTDEPFAGIDLYSVALHEIAHVLGFGTADSFQSLIDFEAGVFTGSEATAIFGSSPSLDDEAHWLDGTTSPIFGISTLQEAAMDPDIAAGFRKRMTDLDMAALSDVGWNVIPEPSTAGMLGMGVLALLSRRRRRCRE